MQLGKRTEVGREPRECPNLMNHRANLKQITRPYILPQKPLERKFYEVPSSRHMEMRTNTTKLKLESKKERRKGDTLSF